MIRILSLLVENNPGTLSWIAGLFSGKSYNLETITAGVTTDPSITRITLVCNSTDDEYEQIKKQLNRLVNVIKVKDITKQSIVKKELAFIKVSAKCEQRAEFIHIAEVYGCKIVDIGSDGLVFEITDSSERIDELLSILQNYDIMEIARSGLVAIERLKKTKKLKKQNKNNSGHYLKKSL